MSHRIHQTTRQLLHEMLTIAPELSLQPARPWQYSPPLGTVLLSLLLGEWHRREHVGHIVALEAHLDLGAGLDRER